MQISSCLKDGSFNENGSMLLVSRSGRNILVKSQKRDMTSDESIKDLKKQIVF